MNDNPVERFLQHTIGLDSASIGADTLQHILHERWRATGLSAAPYAAFLHDSQDEQKRLIETVVVLETWFFRHHRSFDFMSQHLQAQSPPAVRLLSLPCATGEEPYSLVMSLLDKGFLPRQIHVDAVDISQPALDIAQQAQYRNIAFRGERGRQAQPVFFQPVEQKNALNVDRLYQLKPEVRSCVHWHQGNILDAHIFPPQPGFDVIFCRNLLIYLTPEARSTAIRHLATWLKPSGLLCVGHAERNLACHEGFVQVSEPGVFACWHPQSPQAQNSTTSPKPLKKPLIAPQIVRPVSDTLSPPAVKSSTPHPLKGLEQIEQLADQGKLEAALQQCRDFLRTQPDAVQGHFLCALIHQARQDEAQAERYFQQTLYLQPHHMEALHHLSVLLQGQGRQAQARSLHQRLQRVRDKAQGVMHGTA